MIELIVYMIIFFGLFGLIMLDKYYLYKKLNEIESEEKEIERELHSLALDAKIKKKIENKVQELRRNGSVG